MLKPYKQVEISNEYVVYEFKTIYLYLLYGLLGIIAVGYFASMSVLTTFGTFLIILYFLLVSTQYMKLSRKIKRAAKTSTVETFGSKWSFSNPLRVKIKKEFI